MHKLSPHQGPALGVGQRKRKEEDQHGKRAEKARPDMRNQCEEAVGGQEMNGRVFLEEGCGQSGPELQERR